MDHYARVLQSDDNEEDKKKFILWMILGGLLLFLVLAAFIIETLLSKSKRDESKQIERIKQREQHREATQIESNVIYEQNTTRKDNIREPIFEEDEREYPE